MKEKTADIKNNSLKGLELAETAYTFSQFQCVYYIFLIILGQNWIISMFLFLFSGILQLMMVYMFRFSQTNFVIAFSVQLFMFIWFHRITEKQNKIIFHEMFCQLSQNLKWQTMIDSTPTPICIIRKQPQHSELQVAFQNKSCKNYFNVDNNAFYSDVLKRIEL